MNKLSNGTKYALLAVGAITLLGAILTYTDYARHGDLSTIWWPVIGIVILAILYFGGRKTDIVPILFLICLPAYSCQRTPVPSADVAMEQEVVNYRDAEGWDRTEAKERP